MSEEKVISMKVEDKDRLNTLPAHFGRLMLNVESMIFSCMSEICDEYRGGYWEFFNLSNGGFFMAPVVEEKMSISVAGNYYEGTMSGDAAGIVATLMALSRMAFVTDSENIVNHFYWLKNFVEDHPEAESIYRAID